MVIFLLLLNVHLLKDLSLKNFSILFLSIKFKTLMDCFKFYFIHILNFKFAKRERDLSKNSEREITK